MSSAFKTLSTSDFSVVPYIALKNAELSNCDFSSSGITVLKGVNTPQSVTGSLPRQAILYRSIRNLYYMNALSSSIGTGSAYEGYYQSTAGAGTLQSDIRYFPTESGATIKVISIPPTVYGQALAPATVKLSNTSLEYYIVDDSNGNLVDLAACVKGLYGTGVNISDYTGSNYITSGLMDRCIEGGYTIGNAYYAQGFLTITDSDYLCVADSGAETRDITSIFLTTDSPKIITPLSSSVVDCSPIDTGSLTLIPISGETFPNYTIVAGKIILDDLDPLTTTEGTHKIKYTVRTQACAISTPSTITVHILDCEVIGGGVVIQASRTPTPTPTQTVTFTPTPSVTPPPTATSTPTPSITFTPTATPLPTSTPTATPASTTTPTPTPTTSFSNIVSFVVCVWSEVDVPDTGRSTIYYKATTSGDNNGDPVQTSVAITGLVSYETVSDGTRDLPLNITIPAGGYTSIETTRVVPYTVTQISYTYNIVVTPSQYSTQRYSNAVVECLNTSTCAC